MERERLVRDGRERWERLEALLARPRLRSGREWTELSSLYRALAADLSRARALDLGGDVQGYLDDLAARAHGRLYGARRREVPRVLELVAMDVPRQVRAAAIWFWVASALFYGPFVLCGIGALVSEDFARQVVDESTLRAMEASYRETPDARSTGESALMTGFYVWNNVGIALRCFATGVLGGTGSVFFLVYNGATLGAVFGHLFQTGRGLHVLTFVAGHTAWELTGIVLSGAAGLRMGWALIATGGRSRRASLRAAAPELARLVLGATVMLLVAAAIEGLWSASPIPAPIKLGFGALQIGLVAAWLLLGGRER